MKNIMKTLSQLIPSFPQSLEELYQSPDFIPFPRSSDEWINDSERMERCHNAAEHGGEGSTHAEIIQDWRDHLDNLENDARRTIENQDLDDDGIEALLAGLVSCVAIITDEIDACESWHEKAGSLHSEIG
jgi:hypothetical protein